MCYIVENYIIHNGEEIYDSPTATFTEPYLLIISKVEMHGRAPLHF